MKKIYFSILLLLLLGSIVPMTASASEQSKPAQFSFWNPWQVWDQDTSIGGFRFNMLYGYNKDMVGIDFGVANRLSGSLSGIQLGTVNMVGGDGLGFQGGAVNLVDGDFVGLQFGALYNSTKGQTRGLQLGLVNVTGTLYGLQIGLLNFNLSGQPLKFLPVFNFSF